MNVYKKLKFLEFSTNSTSSRINVYSVLRTWTTKDIQGVQSDCDIQDILSAYGLMSQETIPISMVDVNLKSLFASIGHHITNKVIASSKSEKDFFQKLGWFLLLTSSCYFW